MYVDKYQNNIYAIAFSTFIQDVRVITNLYRGSTKMARKRTESERLRDNMPEREKRFERLRDNLSKGGKVSKREPTSE